MLCLSGISSCSHHAVSGTSSQTLSSAVAVMFIPYLQQEGAASSRPDGPVAPPPKPPCAGDLQMTVLSLLCCPVHEGTLVHAVSVLSQWTSRLTVQVPAALLDWLKKAFSLKTSTSLVRHAYLQAMLGAFRGGLVNHATHWY